MMPFVTRSELRWSRYISFSYAICKTDYRELKHYLTITRCYAINRDIDWDCPGSMCHSARLAQSNLPTKHESERKDLNSGKLLERRVDVF